MSISTEIQRLQNAKENIKNAIEESGVSVGNGLLDTYPDKIDGVYKAGVSNGKNVLLDNVIYIGRKNYQYAFARWKDGDFSKLNDIHDISNAFWMFSYGQMEEIDAIIDLTVATNINNMFSGCTKLKKITKIKFSDTCSLTFTNPFQNCVALEEVRFEGKIKNSISFAGCTKLTKPSIESIVRMLFETPTSEAVLTIPKTAVDNAFETSTGAADGESSDEWINLIRDKSNKYNGFWTITLS